MARIGDWSHWLVRQQCQQQSQIAPVVPVRCWSDGLVGLLVATIGRSLSDGRIAWSGCWYWSVSHQSEQRGAPRLLVASLLEQQAMTDPAAAGPCVACWQRCRRRVSAINRLAIAVLGTASGLLDDWRHRWRHECRRRTRLNRRGCHVLRRALSSVQRAWPSS